MPLISIIVPVYNVEFFLAKCLDSLINQTYSNIEIICINDGSTDSSLEILQQYKKQSSKIKIISTDNRGLASARNLGLNNASGDFLTFVDSDDWLDPETIETVYKDGFFNNPKIDVVCFGIRRVINNDKTPYRSYTSNQIRPINDSYALTLSVEACGKLYRRQFLLSNHIMFPVGLYYEDITFHWACISYANEVVTTKSIFYNYRMRDDSIMGASNNKKPHMAIHHLYNLERLYEIWSKNKFIIKHNRLYDYIFELYVQQGYKFLRDEDISQFVDKVQYLVKKLKLQPKKFSLTYDLVNNKQIMPFKYRWAKSIRKKLLTLNLL